MNTSLSSNVVRVVAKNGSVRSSRGVRSAKPSASAPLASRAAFGSILSSKSRTILASKRSFVVKAEEEVETVETKPKADEIDPADGSVAYGAPLGEEGTKNLEMFGSMFSNARSTEILNGRAAMVGFVAALFFEFTKGTSLVNQIFSIRTFKLLDGNETTVTYPGGGFYLAALTVLVVLVASFVPKAKGVKENGLDVEPKEDASPLPRFTAENELFNGRAAMVGLVALYITEAILGRAEF